MHDLSTTALGFHRGGGGLTDRYEAGTVRERAYMRSIKVGKLGTALIEELDDEVFLDIDADDEGVVNIDAEVVDPATQELFEWDLYN